ncbi:hypothetical protein [Methanolobus sp.]|uniref:hypothetical protein n=1 Tax=Methanolobus sp. TaxID=1874737 RepID=UPI0025F49D96|nr:hypothetical protein [Methanolobus sp.]
MKFLENLFRKKPKVAPQDNFRLEFGRLPELVRAESKKEVDDIGPVIRAKYTEIETSLEDLRDIKKSLFQAKPIENANKRMEKLGDSNRDNVAHNLDLIIEKITLPRSNDPRDAIDLYTDSRSVMKTVVDNTRRSQMYIKSLYPQEFGRMKQGLTELENRFGELHSILRAEKEKMDAFERLPGVIENIHLTEKDILQTRKNIQSLESKHQTANKKLSASISELDALEKSSEFEKAKALEDEIHALEVKISAIDSDIERLFAPLSKAISRMEKQDKNEIHVLSVENRTVLAAIKDKPDSLTKNELDPFLDELAARVKSKDLGLKDQMYAKMLAHVSKLKDPATISDLRDRKEGYSSRMNELTAELKQIQVYRNRERLVNDRIRYTDMVKSIEEELTMEITQLESLTEQHDRSKAELHHELVPVFGENIEVIYDDPHKPK